MKRLLFFLIVLLQISLCIGQDNFSFVFLPDIHLEPDSAIEDNFDQIVQMVNKLNPEFVITGGDMIYTAKNVNDKKAEILFNLMDDKFTKFKMPVYYTMGNHELVGITKNSGIDSSHPKWGKRMYEERYGKRYKSFSNYGWKFFLLDGIKIRKKKKDYGLGVDSKQMEWIKNELEKTDKNVPIVISIHSPLISPKAMTNTKFKALSKNARAVFDLFKKYNLKIVLQGHNHTYMNLYIGGIHYISGGSTLPRTGKYDKGFLLVKLKNDIEDIEFIHTGLEVSYN